MITRVVIDGYRIFDSFQLAPNEGVNIIVGDNEAGKSTLLEAIALALTGRHAGRWAQDELSPYWFNRLQVDAFFDSLSTGTPSRPPEILVEVFLGGASDDLQPLRGVHNSLRVDAPGLRIHIAPSPAYQEEFREYLAREDCPRILPTEWYEVDWRDFSDEKLTRRPKGLGVSIIDSRTIRSAAGVDYHTRDMLSEFIEPRERAAIAVAHRSARHDISRSTLTAVNERIAEMGDRLHDRTIGLHMDQSANSSWENTIVPQVQDIPFSMAGQGQQASIKVSLAMSRGADRTSFAFIEEPENHLSHTSLTKLVARIESLAGSRQTFITTHSSFVLNRLGLDKLLLLHRGKVASFDDLPADTVTYFKRLSGYDTLRLVLASAVIMVEGPSDEMVIERAFRDSSGGEPPMAKGIDVISMAGVSLKRGMQLCAALDRRCAAVRDNDGKAPDHWREQLLPYLSDSRRDVFIGDPSAGNTLEPQFVAVNDEASLHQMLGVPEGTGVLEWMAARKTEWALTLEQSDYVASYPQYLLDAISFVS